MRKKKEEITLGEPHRPARDPDEQRAYMIHLAEKAAEKQLLDGTASSQVIVHYLKLGSPKEMLEEEILKKQKVLIEAKTEALHSSKEIAALYKEAIEAMQMYNGSSDDD